MNLFSFTAHFGSEDACRLYFKHELDKIGITVVNVVVPNIFGLKAVGVMNANFAGVEPH